MGLSINDLQPKKFEIELSVTGETEKVIVMCLPLRLSHALIVSKIGDVFKNVGTATSKEIKDAEASVDDVVAELIPELKDIKLDMKNVMELITAMMGQIEPEDNKELSESGVKFDTDPKVETIG